MARHLPPAILIGTSVDFSWHGQSWSIAHQRLCDGSTRPHTAWFYVRNNDKPWQEIYLPALVNGIANAPICVATADLAAWLEQSSELTDKDLQVFLDDAKKRIPAH